MDKRLAKTYRITPTVLGEWQQAENASWEDHGCLKTGHVYCILCRAKTRIYIHNRDEAAWLIHSAYYQGDKAGLDVDIQRTREAIGRLGKRIAADYGMEFIGGSWYNEAPYPDKVKTT